MAKYKRCLRQNAKCKKFCIVAGQNCQYKRRLCVNIHFVHSFIWETNTKHKKPTNKQDEMNKQTHKIKI